MKIEQYLALSILSYSKSLSSFASSSGEPSIEALIKQGKIDDYRHNDGSISLELKSLSSLASWHLINATTTSSGMSAIAVQDPATKDIVFAYRGTDIDKNIWEAMKDIESDFAIAPSGNVLCRMG